MPNCQIPFNAKYVGFPAGGPPGYVGSYILVPLADGVETTVNVAALLVALPPVLVATHLNSALAVADAMVYDALWAPPIFAQVFPPSVLCCH